MRPGFKNGSSSKPICAASGLMGGGYKSGTHAKGVEVRAVRRELSGTK
jgi:hypothetical protein